ncbi:3-methyl-2-oxobutanoate hydroxymethyltransferase [Mycolicibacterium frederiksbergense]|uniref:3-methyl-2-oxobutanoate hydroxymethyltransferase n=1 Tax=Mycolicibacterium frederiksbergense TaxID=117567 RepID=A0A6H0RZT6_9MYCO|nr:3-methyl-2-oxobutanoate hydroxymethyltransferase [Mycolicibacterium frederiksbergense]QIV79971.1 3-methyl-2-oxobutanoate hydroxymethyltransferase [Mycolicibacterium frederiksbergense]
MTRSFRPILGSSCSRATLAAEMRHRIDRPIAGRQGARIIALDAGAHSIVERLGDQPWGHARLLSLTEPVGDGGERGSVSVVDTDGAVSALVDELAEADVVVMVATTDADAAAASIIGAACTVRAIMTAGVVIGEDSAVGPTVSVLRPHARVLIVSGHEHDVSDLLTALRA